MFKTGVLLLLFSRVNPERPGKLFRETWGNRIIFAHLHNMTENICKDVIYRVRMADRIQEEYKNSTSYELGLLAAGIMDKFKHMMRVYRYYSNHTGFKSHKNSLDQILNGYSVMMGDYNEIRLDRELYLDILEEHKRRHDEEDRQIEEHAANKPGMSADGLKKHKTGGKLTRKSMTVITNSSHHHEDVLNTISKNKRLKLKKNRTEWTKNGKEEAEYKKKLRYIMWAKRWNGFNPETEGVYIPDPIAKIGLANASNFLMKELQVGDYNEIRLDRELYLDILEEHKRRHDEEDRQIEEHAANKPGMSADGLKKHKTGGKLTRKSMTVITNSSHHHEDVLNTISKNKRLKLKKNRTEWTKNGKEEAEYKKKLRYIMWAKRWNGFNPETEGVYIPDPIAKMGLANASNFLMKELQGKF